MQTNSTSNPKKFNSPNSQPSTPTPVNNSFKTNLTVLSFTLPLSVKCASWVNAFNSTRGSLSSSRLVLSLTNNHPQPQTPSQSRKQAKAISSTRSSVHAMSSTRDFICALPSMIPSVTVRSPSVISVRFSKKQESFSATSICKLPLISWISMATAEFCMTTCEHGSFQATV